MRRVRSIIKRAERYLFEPVSAEGFGLMRIVWGCALLWHFGKQFPDVLRYYSAAGQLPPWLDFALLRMERRFSILVYLPHPDVVFLLYILFLTMIVCATLGIFPRMSTIVTTVLLFSFHERNPWHTTGGDVILRAVGFLLSIAPGGVYAFSLHRRWRSENKKLPLAMMPVWPRRLALWQLLVVYMQSLWSKMLGTAWWAGTAPATALHHNHFGRFAESALSDLLSTASPLIAWGFMLFEASWLLILVPKTVPHWPSTPMRRILIAGSLLIHMGMFALLRLGSFFLAIPAILAGNLHGEDVEFLRNMFKRTRHL